MISTKKTVSADTDGRTDPGLEATLFFGMGIGLIYMIY
jgi:hypothetical protein